MIGQQLAKVRAEAQACHACALWRHATQTVFGEGSAHAEMMLVGEQPGDREDVAGRPFVGPAGGVLDEALAAAGVDRSRLYVTNVVKHFKWQPRDKVWLHKKPSATEVAACRPWLELALVRPVGVLCLGATAAQALLGAAVRARAMAFLVDDLHAFATHAAHPQPERRRAR